MSVATAVLAQEETASTSVVTEIEATTDPVTVEGDVDAEVESSPFRPLEERVEERRDEIKETVAERREQIQENIAERRAALASRVQERITNLAANISNRMEAAIVRLENIVTRLESRIAKLDEADVDVTAAAEALVEAQTSLDLARVTLAGIDAQVSVAVGSENPREDWQAVKAVFTETRDHIKSAHEQLRAVVALLKQAVLDAELGSGVSSAVQAEGEAAVETE